MRQDTQTGTQGLSSWIEKARTLMPQQYSEEMNLYNQRATQPVLNKMSSRGILDSSVTGGALSDVLRDTQAKQSESAKRLNRLMPQSAGLSWDELQKEAEYQHAKGLLKQLKLIA